MLWLCDEDAGQRDAMTSRAMRFEFPAGGASPFPPGIPRGDTLRLPLPPGHPPRRFRMTGELLPDFWRTADGEPVVSAALRDALCLPPEVAQAVPIALESDDGRAHAKGYALLRVLAEAACMDHGQSVVEKRWITNPLTGQRFESVWVRRFVLDPAAIAHAALFRAAEDPRVLVATDALAARVLAGNHRGIVFGDPRGVDDHGRPRSHRAPDGGAAPAAEPSAVLPVRDPARRPPFDPDPGLRPVLRPIEAAIRHRLPEHYVRFLLDPPAQLLCSDACDYDLMTHPADVASLNRRVRAAQDHFLHDGSPWPDDWLLIGQNGCGDFFALDLAEPSPPVLFWDHETGVASVASPSLDAFMAAVIARGSWDGPD